MPVQVTYPGVYIEELPSGVHAITGVATSIAAFVDAFSAGPLHSAVRILSFADFERQFGGLSATSEASYAIQQFFLNGGTEAYVVRVTSSTHPAVAAAIGMADEAGNSPVLVATAADPGSWGNNLLIDVDYNARDPTKQFNLTATEIAIVNGVTSIVATETFRNLVLDPSQSNDASAVVNAASQLIKLEELSGSTGKLPAQNGTSSNPLANYATHGIGSLNLATADTIDVAIGSGNAVASPALSTVWATIPTTLSLADLAVGIQNLLRNTVDAHKNHISPNATVTVVGSASTTAYLVAAAGTSGSSDILVLTGSLATKLGFDKHASQNVQHYVLGSSTAAGAQTFPPAPQGQQPKAQPGTDGGDPSASPPAPPIDAKGLIGDQLLKQGIYALMDVDLFNILCIPATMNLPDGDAAQVATQAISLCTSRRAMYLLDAPQHDAKRDTVDAILTWLDANSGLRSRNAALYFPRTDIADPLAAFRSQPRATSGTVAGLWARIDGARGVWKAPAGTEASLAGVQSLEYKLTDPENGVLNPLAINCLRVFPVYGPVCWGARTLFGADQLADDYKYVPVRRLALFLEESLFRGTQWVVFEPNDSPLWAQVRLNVGTFMQTLFRQGAFQGATPSDAYFVKCDSENNPPATVNLGILYITVGFAPLKPAEFVVIQIQQMAGQTAG